MFASMAEDKPKSRLQQEIDENLKRVYDDALQQDVPDRFKLLLEQLKARQSGAEPGSGLPGK